MFETVDESLRAWAGREAGAEAALFGPLPIGTPGLQFSLLDILPSPAPRGATPVPLRFTLRYLVTAAGASPTEAHALLGRALLAAMRDPQMREELGPVPPALFQALGWPPQPAFYLLVPVSIPREFQAAPPVRTHQIGLSVWPAVRLNLTVLGPDGQALPGVQVSLGTDAGALTDDRGQVSLGALQTPEQVKVRWKGQDHALPVPQDGLIRLPVPESS